jgi:hypothetical protein
MKTCKACKTEFTPTRPMQKVCSPMCALEVSRQVAQKKAAKEAQEDRKKTREKLDAMRTKPQLVKLAQIAFNSYIRARDAGKPCICCGKPLGTEPNSFDAGHYRSVGSAPHMRFVEDNVHGQTKYCNNYLASNPVGYRKGLIERIGLDAVEKIEADQTVRKYTHEGLVEIARYYNAEARRLKKERE